MKRTLAFLLALIMTVTMLPMSVFAAEKPTFAVTSASGKAGDEVTVAVEIANNPGIWSMNYGIEYDTTRLEKVEYTSGGMDGQGTWTIIEKILWDNSTFDNSTYNGETVVLKFKIKEDAPAGDAEIKIKDFFACNSDGNIINADFVAGKVTVAEKLETLIPFTKANHTDSGAHIHDKYSGIVGLKVEGIKVADWTEWKQGGNYQNQGITIYVDPASKDDTATLSFILKEGQAGSGSIIDAPATVKLNNGEGSFTASYMKIGTGALAPMLHIPITFELAKEECEHDWADATCSAPKTCTLCGATEGEPNPDAHNYVDGVCEYCGDVKEPETYEVKIFGSVNDCFYVSEGKSESGNEIIGEKLEGVYGKENGEQCIVLAVPNDVTRICYFEESIVSGFNVSPENNVANIDYIELTVKTPDGKGCENAEVSIVDEEGYNVLAYDYEWRGMYSMNGVEGVKYTFTVTAPGYKTAVVEKVFEYADGYQTFDIVLECNHNWADATCEAPKTCTLCGATEGEALGHDWNEIVYNWAENGTNCTASRVCKTDETHIEYAPATVTSEVEKEPTCTESGITKYTATFDVDWAETQTNKVDIEALGHNWVDATCEAPKTCTVCGATEGEALGHDYEYETVKEPTCTEEGERRITCKNGCGYDETETIDALGHEWSEWEVVKEASYTEEGSKKRVCENDESHVETETIAKLVPTATEKVDGYHIAYQEDVVIVPENLNVTVQDIKDALTDEVEKGSLKGEVVVTFMEATIGYFDSNNKFVPIDSEDYFKDGKTIDITLPYPKDGDADKNDNFEVYHYLDNGRIEKCVIKEKNDKGLVIEVDHLSPFVIAYQGVSNVPSKPSKPVKPSDKDVITIVIPKEKAEESNPNTGAPVLYSFDLTAAGVVVLAATAAVLEIKRRK